MSEAHRLHVANAVDSTFDGDKLNIELLLDENAEKAFDRLRPDLYAFDVNSPRKVAKFLDLESPVITTIDNWLEEVIPVPRMPTSPIFRSM